MVKSKLDNALGIAKEAASINYRSAKVCENQCKSLVRACHDVYDFLSELIHLVSSEELKTDVAWDPLIVTLRRGLELLKSCESDDCLVRALLCHESREDFLDICEELFSSVKLLSAWLIKLGTIWDSQQHSVIREAWSSFARTKTEHSDLEDAARIDREQLPDMAHRLQLRRKLAIVVFTRFRKQDFDDALQMLFNLREEDQSELEKRFAIDRSQIKLKEHIGRGAYGSIFNTRWLGRAFAVNVFHPGDKSFPRELAVLASHKHPNILGIVGHSYDKRKQQHLLVMEKMDMDLEALLRTREEVLPLAKSLDIAKGMAWLHSKGVIHRDLKPGNILVSQSLGGEHLTVKISDFGLARTNFITSRISGATMKRGTKFFMAPKVWNSDHYSKKADVYSFAMLSYQVLTGAPPFRDIYEQRNFMDSNGSRPVFPPGMAKRVTDFVESCWKGNAEERPGFKQIRDGLIMLKANTLIEEEESKESPISGSLRRSRISPQCSSRL